MSPSHKAVLLGQVASSPHPRRQVLRELGIPKSTYYRWLGRQHHRGLDDRPGGGKPPWNRLTAEEEQALLAAARQLPELSCRQLAAWITDNEASSSQNRSNLSRLVMVYAWGNKRRASISATSFGNGGLTRPKPGARRS